MTCPILRPDIQIIKTDSGGVINHFGENVFSFISYTQYDILRACNGNNSVDDIAEIISIKYDVPLEKVKKDVSDYIEHLKKHRVIAISPVKVGNVVKSKEFMPKNSERIIKDVEIPSSKYPTKYSKMFMLWLILSERCPLECTYCNMALEAKHKPTEEVVMKISDAIRLINEAKQLGAIKIGISGGEITAHPKIFEVIRHVFNIGLQDIVFGTKAVGITEKFAKKLYLSGARSIQISIDTMDADTYKKLIPNGSLSSALQGIYNLMNAGFKIRVRSTITRYNIEEIPQLWNFMYDIGASSIGGFVVYPEGRADRHLLPTREQIKWLEDTIKEKFKNKRYIPEVSYFKCGIPQSCSAGILSLAAYPNGNVTLCDSGRTLMKKYPEKFVFGNFKRESLKEIWENSKLLNEFRQRKFSSPCSSCPSVYNCLRGCPVISEIVFGNPDLPDPLCIKQYPYDKEGNKREFGTMFLWDVPKREIRGKS